MAVTLTIKNVPEEIADRLKERARNHHRSLQGELMALIEEAVGAGPGRPIDVHELLAHAKSMKFPRASDAVDLVRETRDER